MKRRAVSLRQLNFLFSSAEQNTVVFSQAGWSRSFVVDLGQAKSICSRFIERGNYGGQRVGSTVCTLIAKHRMPCRDGAETAVHSLSQLLAGHILWLITLSFMAFVCMHISFYHTTDAPVKICWPKTAEYITYQIKSNLLVSVAWCDYACRVLSLSDRRYSLNPLNQTRIDWVGRYRIRWTFKLSYAWRVIISVLLRIKYLLTNN